MAFDETLAKRVAKVFSDKEIVFITKKMMGGLCFMVDDKMCVGVDKDRLMVRLDPEDYLAALSQQGCHPMDFTGRPLKGFVFVDRTGIETDAKLEYWIEQAIAFNPRAKSSKRTKRSP